VGCGAAPVMFAVSLQSSIRHEGLAVTLNLFAANSRQPLRWPLTRFGKVARTVPTVGHRR
jgi:hypothetical protein